jgi:hypothetical protein
VKTQKNLIERVQKNNISFTNLVSEQDLECQLCLDLLNDPVNCPCGHVWCRSCLLSSLKHSKQCPMCRTILPQVGYFLARPSCKFTEKIVELIKPKLIKTLEESITILLFISTLGFPGSRLSFRMFSQRDRVISN